MKHLFVWVRQPDGTTRLAGELATTDPNSSGRFESEFEYAAEWLQDIDGFPLDPVSLPLSAAARWRAELFHPPLGVIEDALPDDWGRQLLAEAIRMERRRVTPAEMLVRMRGGGTGALLFTESSAPPEPDVSLQTTALATLLSAATRFEAGTLPHDASFRRLLAGSSRAGGARPKALVHDASGEWIAKFPSRTRDESHDVIGLEATCLELARRSGLAVPEARLQRAGRRRVLLVRRFDVTDQGGRLHMVSMQTLCRERPGVYAPGYSELMQVLRKHSASPAADVSRLFHHLVFNAAIGNVDDHLKNFWMLATPRDYRLAPAFDLVPDIAGRGQHTLMFEEGFGCPTRKQVESLGRAWKVTNASAIVERVIESVRGFPQVCRRLKVGGGKRLGAIVADVARRVRLLCG